MLQGHTTPALADGGVTSVHAGRCWPCVCRELRQGKPATALGQRPRELHASSRVGARTRARVRAEDGRRVQEHEDLIHALGPGKQPRVRRHCEGLAGTGGASVVGRHRALLPEVEEGASDEEEHDHDHDHDDDDGDDADALAGEGRLNVCAAAD